MVVIGAWSRTLIPGEEYEFAPIEDVQITSAAYDETVAADASGRSVVKIEFMQPELKDEDDDDDVDDEDDDSDEMGEVKYVVSKGVLASLSAGRVEHQQLNFVIPSTSSVTLSVTGSHPVSLLGYFIRDESSYDRPPHGYDSDFDSDDDESEYLEADEDVSTRFEEIVEAPKAKAPKTNKKRPAESSEPDNETEATSATKTGETKLSKNQRKKVLKKLKGEKGEAVPTASEEIGKENKVTKKAGAGEATQKAGTEPLGASDKARVNEGEKPEKEKKDANATEKGKKEKAHKLDPGATKEKITLPSGVVIRDEVIGSGPSAQPGKLVQMRYIGKLSNGTVFDKNVKGEPFKFRLGKGEVIKGWDDGIKGMTVGTERQLIIPPNLGYGKRGTDGIPPNSTLIFDVKLLSVK